MGPRMREDTGKWRRTCVGGGWVPAHVETGAGFPREQRGELVSQSNETGDHSEDEWVVGDVYTNSIEGGWSLFKRSLVGAFHKVRRKHLGRDLEELEWRFTNRNHDHIFRDTLQRIVNTYHLTHQQLTA